MKEGTKNIRGEGPPNTGEPSDATKSLNFIELIIEEDISNNKNGGKVHTRFPPEPNGFLHIGHAKAICLDFGLATKYNGVCNLRFDDTNPEKEESIFVNSIKEDIKWLGFDWEDREYYASDYFEQLYEYAVQLIKVDKAFVDDLTNEEISRMRGTPTEPGQESPYRSRSIEENLTLFEQMKKGEFEDGAKILRAKIDMASPNMHMRDPAIYRIKRATHHRTGDKWCIYPMYDWAHGLSDSIEGITHSLCTLEFEVHRPLYDWCLEQLKVYQPRQIEFARLNLSYTIMSKRMLQELVEEQLIDGWDDPRMPTLSGMRRRGYTADSIRNFAEKVGIAKRNNIIDIALLEHSVREDLNKKANRVMSVLHPVKVIIDNYPDGQEESLDAINNPEDPEMGKRKVPFSKELFIEADDFMEDPPRKFFRLAPGREVRLRYGYFITCNDIVKDAKTGDVTEIHCTYDPATKGGSASDGRKVKGTIHWVSAKHALIAEVRVYERLFLVDNPAGQSDGSNYKDHLNTNSLEIINNVYVEPSMKDTPAGAHFQFERKGYFCVDPDTSPDKLVFNQTVTLRDSWAKVKPQGK